MKILSFYYTDKLGGFCTRLFLLLNTLCDTGNEVWYLSLDYPKEKLSNSINFIRIPFFTHTRQGFFFWVCFTLWCPIFVASKALFIRPNKYVVFGAYYSSMLCLARIIYKKPLILFLRSLVFKIDKITNKPFLIRALSKLMEKYGILSADKVICMTNSMQKDVEVFIGRKLSNVAILPNNIPLSKENKKENISNYSSLKFDKTTFKVLTSGVIDERKNINFLIEVFKEIQRIEQNIILIIAGDGPLLNKYQRRVERENLENIKFLGWCKDMNSLLKDVDIVVHPSLHEGVSNSVLEALAHKIPILLSDIPEHREILELEEGLFSLFDVNELSKKIINLAKDPKSFSAFKAKCLKSSSQLNFNWNDKAISLIKNA